MHESLDAACYDSNDVIPAKAGIEKGKLFNPQRILFSRLRGPRKKHKVVRLVCYDSNDVIPAKAGIQKGK
jgi:hypothetical protein